METRRKTGGEGRRGGTMLTVVIALGAMTVLSLVYLRVGQRVTDEQLTLVDAARASYLAEAGIAEAIAALGAGEDGSIGTADVPAYLAGGVVWVEATDLGGGRTQLDSMAMKDGGRAALRVVVEDSGGEEDEDGDSGEGDGFLTMLYANKQLNLNQNVVIDSWDSSLGPYALQATNLHNGTLYAGAEGGASSNQSVQVHAGVKVFGDVHAGPTGSVSLADTAYVSGTTTPGPVIPLAPIKVPDVPVSGAYSVANFATKTIDPGTYHFTSMTQGKNSTLKVIGPATIVMGSYMTGTTATLEVDCTNGPVTFYDTGPWTVDKFYTQRAKLGTPVNAAFLISSPTTVQFGSGSKIGFGFYVPSGTIQVNQGAEVWGALVADLINVDQGTRFHFDKNLEKYSLPWIIPDPPSSSEPEALEVLAWSKIEFPIDAYRADRRSPFTLLDVQPAQLPSPAEAWHEQQEYRGR